MALLVGMRSLARAATVSKLFTLDVGFNGAAFNMISPAFGDLSSPSRIHFARSYRARHVAPIIWTHNSLKERVRTDSLIRHGKEQFARRSDFLDWNYNAELYAFGVRLGERFDDKKLREALVDPSYVDKQKKHLDLPDSEALAIVSNDALADAGLKTLRTVLSQYVRASFPLVPEEGVQEMVSSLVADDILAEVAFHIGTRDLILAVDYPPKKHAYARTMCALVAALEQSQGPQVAARFVVDLVGVQLHSLDVTEFWNVDDPMRLLSRVLDNSGMQPPESRLLWASGKDTILACFHIGIYSNKELIGQSPGETVEIAEEMAARDALRRLFGMDDSRSPLLLGDKAAAEMAKRTQPNPSLAHWRASSAKATQKLMRES